jgi:hypothetical protein
LEHACVFFKKSFKVEASWMHDYDMVVQEAWVDDENDIPWETLVTQKLASCQTKLMN